MSTNEGEALKSPAANEISDPDLLVQIEAEAKNFEVTTKYLGNTVELVQDFQDAYKTLASFVLIPDGGEATERAKEKSVGLGRRLRDKRHLAIVCTALGKFHLAQGRSLDAIEALDEAFDLEIGFRNKRGVNLVVGSLCEPFG